jgi:hypothetical protein
MKPNDFVLGLENILKSIPIPQNIDNELDLERILFPYIKSYLKKSLRVKEEELKTIVYAHGENEEGKGLWTKSKEYQNVIAFGCTMAADIFIRHGSIGTIFIEIKLAKPRKSGGDSFPGSLQRAIGQTVIASMKHNYAICYIATPKRSYTHENDIAEKLIKTIWEKLGILLIIKEYGRDDGKELIEIV